MSLWRQITHGLRALTNRAAADRDVDDEIRDYFERSVKDRVGAGSSGEDAERIVRRELAEAARAHEELRAYGWENTVEATVGDFRQALRRLRLSPGFSTVAVLTLALGIGASTAIFSVLAPILLEPLPYPDAERVVMLTDFSPDGAPLDTTYGTYVEIAARSRMFDALAVADHWNPAISGGVESERVIGDRVSADYFRVLGIAPALGRAFNRDDEAIGGPQLVIVSDALAKRRFGGARAVLDQTIDLDGVPHTVIGVMPAGFDNVLTAGADVWSAMQYNAHAPFQSGEWGHHLRMIGRLREGVSTEQAQREIAAVGGNPVTEFPRPEWASLEHGLRVEPLQDSVTAGARPVLFAVAGAVVLLLGLACANVTNLLLARGVTRHRELAVRAALGAGRSRLVRQLLTESLLLALLGGAAGLGLAFAGVRAIVALAPEGLPRIDAVQLDLSAFLFACAVTTLAGLIVGLAPALRGTRFDLRLDLHSGERAMGGSQQSLRRGLVVVEVALALVLLVGAGLLLRSVERLFATAPGFDASNRLTMQVVATGYRLQYRDGPTGDPSSYRIRTDAEAQQLFQSMLDAIRAVPGVVDAAFTTQLPLSGDYDAYGVRFESAARPSPTNTDDGSLRYVVTPDYFRTMGIPLLSGRLLDARDRPGAPEAVVLSESLAKRYFGDRDPLGQRLRVGPENFEPDRPWDTVVGVVGDVKQSSLDALAPPDAFYIAMGQWPWVDLVQSLVVRTDGNAIALVPVLKDAISSVDSTPAITRVATMEDLVAASEAERRFALTVFAAFAATALVLAAVGLYGVIAGSVAERTREIGLRSALGATPGRILSLVVRQGMALAGVGVAVGVAIAAAATRGLETLLYGVTSLDPATFLGVTTLLVAVAAIASSIPAWRASRVDPTTALRTE